LLRWFKLKIEEEIQNQLCLIVPLSHYIDFGAVVEMPPRYGVGSAVYLLSTVSAS
jgi:hypothetical protein